MQCRLLLVLDLDFCSVGHNSIPYMRKVYLPMLLIKVGLFNLMCMDSLIVLAKQSPFPPIMLQLSKLVRWPVVLWWPWCWCLEVFLVSFNTCSVLEDSPIYSSSQSNLLHLHLYVIPFSYCPGSLSLGDTSMFLIVLLPLKHVWMSFLLQIFFTLLHRPCTYGMTMYHLDLLVVVVLLLLLLLLCYCWAWFFFQF